VPGLRQPIRRQALADVVEEPVGHREPRAADERQEGGEPADCRSDRVDGEQVPERDPERGERQQPD
jgi:hypothetical protein